MTDTPTSDGVFYMCEACREKIDPDAPDTARAVERITTWAMGGRTEQSDGLGVFFHARHYPTASRRYRRVD
jgi:hypothetical protein